jgi:hypothetical protein
LVFFAIVSLGLKLCLARVLPMSASGCYVPSTKFLVCVNLGFRLAYNKTFADCGGAMFIALMSLALGKPHASASKLHHHNFLFLANTFPLGLTDNIISGFLEQEISMSLFGRASINPYVL